MNTSPERSRNLRIAFILCENIDRETGVLKKMAMQMRYWKTKGHVVKLFVAAQSDRRWEGLADIDVDITVITKFSDKWDRNLLYKKIQPWTPDMLYLRYSWLYSFISKLISRYPSIMEINSDDYSEMKISELKRGAIFKYMYYRLTRNRLYRHMVGFVYLTDELKQKLSKYNKPGVVISNGIDIDKFDMLPATGNKHHVLFFMGTSKQPWHGVDKIVTMANRFPEWEFELVGFAADDIDAAPPKNMRFHGFLNYKDYIRILSTSDIAIGTLALHRKNMNEASPLKVRECLACGLPVIIGYKDTDFPDGAPFLLQLPNTETNVGDNLDAIDKFVLAWNGKRVEAKYISNLNLDIKEDERLAFFQKIIKLRVE